MASEPNRETDHTVDLGPFTHEREAALCQQVMGERAHGLDVVRVVAS